MEPWQFEGFRGLTDKDMSPKPVFYTLKLLIQKREGRIGVSKEHPIVSEPYVWMYRFGSGDGAACAAWYDSPSGEAKWCSIPVPWDVVLITHIITEPGITEPSTEILSAPGGILQVTLDDAPIFIEQY